jgi:hypothetical protein
MLMQMEFIGKVHGVRRVRSLLNRRNSKAGLPASHSHTVSTLQPCLLSFSRFEESRATLPRSLLRQNVDRVEGNVAEEHPL